jgi:CDP-4-dehydro-6-deoxyglucose reductase, E3
MTATTHSVLIAQSGTRFTVAPDQTILAAALNAGVTLAYGCRNGACGACKGSLISGELVYGEYQEKALTAAERAAGKALFCCSRPVGDVVIEAREVNTARDVTVKTLPARVEKIERPVDDVAVLYLKLPAAERLQFMAGQYIDILMKDGKRRSYSMANAPHDDQYLQLHVRKSPNGAFSQYVFEQMKERAILRFEGPMGTFFLREESDRPIIFMAGGTGFAPVKAILEHAFMKRLNRQMILYWGVRTPGDLYMPGLPSEWAADYSHFTFIPVVSEVPEGASWSGRTGLVHEAIAADFSDMSGYCVYACGGPAMIDAAKPAFFARGLPEEEFYCDSFTPAIDVKVQKTEDR